MRGDSEGVVSGFQTAVATQIVSGAVYQSKKPRRTTVLKSSFAVAALALGLVGSMAASGLIIGFSGTWAPSDWDWQR